MCKESFQKKNNQRTLLIGGILIRKEKIINQDIQLYNRATFLHEHFIPETIWVLSFFYVGAHVKKNPLLEN